MEDAIKRLEQIGKAWDEKSAEFKELMTKRENEIATLGTQTKDTAAEVEKMTQSIMDLQQQFEALKTSIASMEAEGAGGEPVGSEDEMQLASPGAMFVKSEQFGSFKTQLQKGGSPHWQNRDPVKVKGFGKSAPARAMNVKTFGNDSFLISTNAGGMGAEFFRPDTPEVRKRQGFIMRSIMTTMDPGEVATIRTRKETAEYFLVTKLTEAISASGSAGARTIKVDRVAGLSTTAPYNTVSMDNGTGAESFTITAITPDDAESDPSGPGTLTTASTASIKAYSLGQLVTADQFAPTLEARLKPKSLDVFEEVTVPIQKIATWTDASKEEMADNVRSQDLIDRRLTSRYGRQEDQDILNGPGGASNIDGFFNHADIPSFDWSASASGTTKLDFIVQLCFQLSVAEHMATDILVHPLDMQDVVLDKGSDGHYIYWSALSERGGERIYGARLHMTTAVEQGKVLVGDFPDSATLYLREDVEISTGQPANYFLENKWAILAEGRCGMNVDLPLGFAVGNFDSAP